MKSNELKSKKVALQSKPPHLECAQGNGRKKKEPFNRKKPPAEPGWMALTDRELRGQERTRTFLTKILMGANEATAQQET